MISCFSNGAEVTLEPTSSVMLTNRRLSKLGQRKYVRGNIAKGLEHAVDMVSKSFQENKVSSATVIILADGKSPGLLTGTAGCDTNATGMQADYCDLELLENATRLGDLHIALSKTKFHLRSILVDTALASKDDAMTFEGFRLASLCNAEYLHDAELNVDSLMDKIYSSIENL